MTIPTFSAQDAQVLIRLAESAPLRNIAQAHDTIALLQRFADWFNTLDAKQEAEKDAMRVSAGTLEQELRTEIAFLKTKLGTGV